MSFVSRFFNHGSKSIHSAAFILGVSAFASALLGLIRDRLLAARFGASKDLDVYFAAFRIPDFIYGIIITGGIVAVFLPLFTEYFQKDKKLAWEFTNNVLNIFLLLLLVLCSLGAVFTPQLLDLIVPGFSLEQKGLAIDLTRIMFLSPIFFGLSSIFAGIIQHFNRFLVYALGPVLYNLSIIAGILFLLPVFGLYGLVLSVIIGAFLHFLIQIPAAFSSGYRYVSLINLKFKGVARLFKLMLPRIIGAAANHINLIIITAIASTLAAGSISIFNFSNNIQHLPIGIIGLSFAMASFPALSRNFVLKQRQKLADTFSLAFRQILFLVVPLSFLIFILRAQIVRIILGSGNFGWWETRLTAACLGIFSICIFASSLIPLLTRTFFSFQDTKRPVIIGLTGITVSISLSFLFVHLLSFQNIFSSFAVKALKLGNLDNIEVIGLALAFSLGSFLQFLLLSFFLKRKLVGFSFKQVNKSFLRIALFAFLMGIIVFLSLRLFAFDMTTFQGVFLQTGISAVLGIAFYLIVSLKSPELRSFKK